MRIAVHRSALLVLGFIGWAYAKKGIEKQAFAQALSPMGVTFGRRHYIVAPAHSLKFRREDGTLMVSAA